MNSRFYNWLIAQLKLYPDCMQPVDEVLIGLVWTACRSSTGTGLAMTPQAYNRTLGFSGSLSGRRALEMAIDVGGHEPFASTVGMAAINSVLTHEKMGLRNTIRLNNEHGNLAVFDHFLPDIKGANIVVVGRYPGLEPYEERFELKVLERQPGTNDYPESAAPALLADADWVFITASSISNGTFPELAELARDAKVVLMGPTTPWLASMREWGVDYLAGVEVNDQKLLHRVIAEGGGRNIFRQAVSYRIADLSEQT